MVTDEWSLLLASAIRSYQTLRYDCGTVNAGVKLLSIFNLLKERTIFLQRVSLSFMASCCRDLQETGDDVDGFNR